MIALEFPRPAGGVSLLVFLALIEASPSRAAERIISVCDAKCTYTRAQLQEAFDSAAATTGPVTILLQEGGQYTGDYVWRVKPDAGPASGITIRTGVNATGGVQPLSRYPAPGVRVCPAAFSQDWFTCATRNPYDVGGRFAKITPEHNNSYAIQTANTGAGAPVSYYRLEWVEVIANAYGGNALVGLINVGVPQETGTEAMLPHHFTFSQVVMRGTPMHGQNRAIFIDSAHTTIQNSFFYDIKSQFEGQVLAVGSSPGHLLVENSYLCCGTENFISGGGGTTPSPNFTIQATPAPTPVRFAIENDPGRLADLWVEKSVVVNMGTTRITNITATNPAVVTTDGPHGYETHDQVIITGSACANVNFVEYGPLAFNIVRMDDTQFSLKVACAEGGSGGVVRIRAAADITAIDGNVLTVSPALPFAPADGDVVETSIVTNGMTFRYNVMTHPEIWRTTAIMDTPVRGLTATGAASKNAALPGGTYSYRVGAFRPTNRGALAHSAAVTNVAVTTSGAQNSVVIRWTAVPDATGYRIYGRSNTTFQEMYWDVANVLTFTDTGTPGKPTDGGPDDSSTGPWAEGHKWGMKNVFEIKFGRNILVEYNIFEKSWFQGQAGPCILFTQSTQSLDADSAWIADVTFRYNVVRECAQFLQLLGTDAGGNESARARRFNIHDNLVYNIGPPYGANVATFISGYGGGLRQHPNRSPADVTFEHNTIHFSDNTKGSASIFAMFDENNPALGYESPLVNFQFRNNILYAGAWGMASVDAGGYAVGRLGIHPAGPLGAGSAITRNALVGARCSIYTRAVPDMVCPTQAFTESRIFTGPFTTIELGDFVVRSTAKGYYNAGTDGKSLGADLGRIEAGIAIADSGIMNQAKLP